MAGKEGEEICCWPPEATTVAVSTTPTRKRKRPNGEFLAPALTILARAYRRHQQRSDKAVGDTCRRRRATRRCSAVLLACSLFTYFSAPVFSREFVAPIPSTFINKRVCLIVFFPYFYLFFPSFFLLFFYSFSSCPSPHCPFTLPPSPPPTLRVFFSLSPVYSLFLRVNDVLSSPFSSVARATM